ncbi:GNAT family N-acetyltransferase [Embleya sp. AB8]|uniref:GNAT family N-acetyltransferase n=1 Tax=Embleya sp. AB8 TaxID=3156304 RepID=UPI003C7180E9
MTVDLDLDGSRLRTLTTRDAPLVVEATGGETGPALWGPRPVGPYSLGEARTALDSWNWLKDRQISHGVVEDGRLVAALGLMSDDHGSVELAYWVRPEHRRRGVALRAVRVLTDWVHGNAGMSRLWLETDPDNLASQGLAHKAGYRLEERLPDHCRAWVADDPAHDRWHDCLIWAHVTGT